MLTFFVGLALITIALIFYYQRVGMLQSPGAANTYKIIPTSQPTIAKKIPTGVKFTLEANEKSASYPNNTNMAIKVVGESNKHNVLGYDIVIDRDMTAYEVVSVTSLLPEFTVLKFVKDDKLTITGILKPSITKEIMFEQTPVAEITLRPKKVGSLLLTVLVSDGSSTSKIMSSDTSSSTVKLPVDDSSSLRLDIN
jgi:hypothetical protein